MGALGVDLYKINLDDNNIFYEDDPDTTIVVAWRNKFGKSRALIKNIGEELIPVAWHPRRWWDWCLPEEKEKKK